MTAYGLWIYGASEYGSRIMGDGSFMEPCNRSTVSPFLGHPWHGRRIRDCMLTDRSAAVQARCRVNGALEEKGKGQRERERRIGSAENGGKVSQGMQGDHGKRTLGWPSGRALRPAKSALPLPDSDLQPPTSNLHLQPPTSNFQLAQVGGSAASVVSAVSLVSWTLTWTFCAAPLLVRGCEHKQSS